MPRLYLVLMMLAATTFADDYQDVITHELVHVGRHPALPVHAPNLLWTGKSFLAVHGFAKVGGKQGYGDVYRSTDDGKTWDQVLDLPTYHCGSMFRMADTIYLLYSDFRHENKLRIRRSADDGQTWSAAVTLRDQALWDGNGAYARHQGFLYKALDEPQPKGPSLPRVLRLPLDADPMVPDNWQYSAHPNFDFPPPAVVRDYQVENGQVLRNNNEGNCVVGPDGKLRVIYRHFERSRGEYSATVFVDDEPFRQRFRNVWEPNPAPGKENCYSYFPGACSGFHLGRDPQTGVYLALTNPVTGETQYPNGKRLGIYRCLRNSLLLMVSDDLVHWRPAKFLLKDGLETTWEDSVRNTGFQQVNFQIVGDDLVWISRTAYDGASNLHDANRITFHRLPRFRQYLEPDGEIAYYSFDQPETLGRDTCRQAGPDARGGNPAEVKGVVSVPGRHGPAAAFDGDAELDVRYRLGTELHGAQVVTVTAWLRVDAMPQDQERAMILDSSVHEGFVGLGLGLAPGKLVVGGRSQRQDPHSNLEHPFTSTKRWVHVAAVWDFADRQLELWIDGKRVAAGEAAFGSDRYRRGIPRERDRLGVGLRGQVDEFHLWRRRVPPTVIARLAEREPANE